MWDRLKTQVLIIGGGAAGCRAAIEAADNGAEVLMVLKGTVGKSGATTINASEMAGYNVPNGVADKDDSPEAYFNDIMKAAAGMADPMLASIIADNAKQSFDKLLDWGVTFEKIGEDFYAFRSCFSSKARTHVIKGHGGPIVKVMYHQINQRPNIKILSDIMVTSLLVDDGECVGAVALCKNRGQIVILAKAVVLATGGAAQIFKRNLNPPDVTGDGYVLGYSAGAKLVNMEFMQAGIGFSKPFDALFGAYIWAGLPEIKNKNGDRFIGKYAPAGISEQDILYEHRRHFPFSCSDISRFIEISVQKELYEDRGTDSGGVFIDLSKYTDDYISRRPDDCGLHRMWQIQKDYFKQRGVDILRTPLEIACFAHAINGGLLIDEKAMTSVAGLYAAGETAGGPHGADRLGGNMMVTCQVFGEIAGRHAALYALTKKPFFDKFVVEDQHLQLDRDKLSRKINPEGLIRRLREETQYKLLIRRTQRGLTSLLEFINGEIAKTESAPVSEGLNPANIEAMNMLQVAKIMSVAALARKESRGSHYRDDYKQLDNLNFGGPNTIIRD